MKNWLELNMRSRKEKVTEKNGRRELYNASYIASRPIEHIEKIGILTQPIFMSDTKVELFALFCAKRVAPICESTWWGKLAFKNIEAVSAWLNRRTKKNYAAVRDFYFHGLGVYNDINNNDPSELSYAARLAFCAVLFAAYTVISRAKSFCATEASNKAVCAVRIVRGEESEKLEKQAQLDRILQLCEVGESRKELKEFV
jgi:hypothetical protein